MDIRPILPPSEQWEEVKYVIHSGFLTTEVIDDRLDVMIGIHEHGRQQFAITTEQCMKVDRGRWIVQETVH